MGSPNLILGEAVSRSAHPWIRRSLSIIAPVLGIKGLQCSCPMQSQTKGESATLDPAGHVSVTYSRAGRGLRNRAGQSPKEKAALLFTRLIRKEMSDKLATTSPCMS